MARFVWTDELRAPLLALRRQGAGPKEIAARLGLSLGQVKTALYDRVAQAGDRSDWPPFASRPVHGGTGGAVALHQARDIRVRELSRSGLTYTEIAGLVGVTRNTVAGILHRARMAEPPPPAAPQASPLDKGGCRWIYGAPPEPGWSCCGEPTRLGSAWCKVHHAKVYLPHKPHNQVMPAP